MDLKKQPTNQQNNEDEDEDNEFEEDDIDIGEILDNTEKIFMKKQFYSNLLSLK